MQLLCAITDWETNEAKRGRAKGNSITSRTVVAGDNWNWCVGTQRGGKDDSTIVGEQFIGCMRQLLPHFEGRDGFDAQDTANRIVAALEKATGTKITRIKDEPLDKLGGRIDDDLGTSYMREHPPQVLKRIFRVSEAEDSLVRAA